MPIRGGTPTPFNPIGLYDALDGTDVPQGACKVLTNLIPDPYTPQTWTCRPAAVNLTSFLGFASPGNVSAMVQIGNRIYGMVATARNSGRDEPFCYDLVAGAFIPVSGTVTSATTPVTQSTGVAWNPPTMTQISTFIIVTHPGFSGGSSPYFGWFDVSNPALPVWYAGNTSTNALPSPPTAIAQFYNRAYFVCAPIMCTIATVYIRFR